MHLQASDDFFRSASTLNPGSSYRGWIPTVSGRLSFSVFGRTTHPTRARRENVSDGEYRFLAIYQERDKSDALLPVRHITGRLWFVFIARTFHGTARTQEYLGGKGFIFTEENWPEGKKALMLLFETLKNYRLGNDQSDLVRHVGSTFTDCMKRLEALAAFSAVVNVCRTGTTAISADTLPATGGAPGLPTDEIRRERMSQLLSAQVFFFIKDIGHNHQHHKETTDTVTDLHQFSGDDFRWRTNTLYNIYRTVIEYKRNPHVSRFNNCLGLIAYAKTFQQICAEELGKEKSAELPKYYSDEVAQSIQAIESKISRELLEDRHRKDNSRNLLLGCIAIIFAYANILQFGNFQRTVSPSAWVLNILNFSITQPLLATAVAIFIFFAWTKFLDRYRDGVFDEFIIRVLQPLRRWHAAAWLIGLALVGLGAFIALASLWAKL